MNLTVAYASVAPASSRRRQQVAQERQRLRLRGDRRGASQAVDGGIDPAVERIDPGQADEGPEVVVAGRERLGEPGARRDGVTGEPCVLADGVGVEPDVLGVVLERRGASRSSGLECPIGIAGHRRETRLADADRRTAEVGERGEVGPRVVDPPELERGIEAGRERAELGRVVADQRVGRGMGRVEVVQREQDRGLGGASRRVRRHDRQRRPGRGERPLVVRRGRR